MPRCPNCDYDLTGLMSVQEGEVSCPECAVKWSRAIESSLMRWPGWRRYILEVLAIPGLVSGVVLAFHVTGVRDLGWALSATMLICYLVVCIIAPVQYSRVPRVRRPAVASLFAGALAASLAMLGVVAWLIYAISA